ncbi:hypothetical protein [Acaryochloris marina]|uniref:Uncharacterized protein n=1 Tax=Acaryochloris marina (strain MBIC 11017) TaxID=329726 RepID=B0CCY8_ACAM1|nr:hypothetical protein [Acaryochloris marina]ABW30430.1 hypothetical protein AM1_5475 [Acaryochloris marina MBIC11017]
MQPTAIRCCVYSKSPQLLTDGIDFSDDEFGIAEDDRSESIIHFPSLIRIT